MKQRRRKDLPRGTFVELVRLVLVALFAVGGWRIAEASSKQDFWRLVGIVLGSAIGYVAGGVVGRLTARAVSAVEHDFERVPAAELLAGVIGLILGLVIAVLASILLFRLPAAVAGPTVAFMALALAFVGYRLGRSKKDELFSAFGLRTPAVGVRPGEVSVLDELQRIADSSDPQRRARGQRGLEVLNRLQQSGVEVVLLDEPSEGDVDGHLVRLAKDRGGTVLTCDANLARVATALDVPVRSMNELAVALRPPFVAGEEFSLHLSREGREHGQGVGFLEDGTMVVVEDGRDRLGGEVRVTVTNVLQTSAGRMVFARLSEE